MNPELFLHVNTNDESLPESHFACPICYNFCENAVNTLDEQEECKHSFCEKCINNWMVNNANCPICRRDIEKLEPNQVIRDWLPKQIVKCMFHEKGCSETGSLNAAVLNDGANFWRRHEKECLFIDVSCKFCHAVMMRKEISIHLKEKCPQLPKSCPFKLVGCTAEISPMHMENHLSVHKGTHLKLLGSAYCVNLDLKIPYL
jgi:hypothetical protein